MRCPVTDFLPFSLLAVGSDLSISTSPLPLPRARQKTASGIFLPSTATANPLPEATVIAVGPGAPDAVRPFVCCSRERDVLRFSLKLVCERSCTIGSRKLTRLFIDTAPSTGWQDAALLGCGR